MTTAARFLQPRAERRAGILRAAATAFAHKGFAATSMEDVAAEAGITKLIVYRHFVSKEELYEAVLEAVSGRLVMEFLAAVNQGVTRGLAARALVRVAREDSDAFLLLWRHAAREPQFADHAERFREEAVGLAATMLTSRGVADPVRLRWGAELVVSWLVDAVIHWLEEGTPERDDEMVALVASSLGAMFPAWRNVPVEGA